MTLIEYILQKVQSRNDLTSGLQTSKYSSPPPELDGMFIQKQLRRKQKQTYNRYPRVVSRIDTSPPVLHKEYMFRWYKTWARLITKLQRENFKLVTNIKKQHLTGKIDCHWDNPPRHLKGCYKKRRNFLQKVNADNNIIYERIMTTKARITTTASLEQSWRHNRQVIMTRAGLPFVLFPRRASDHVDPVFLAPPAFQRPRVRMSLRVLGGACVGSLTIELFTDVCPLTCRLFIDLMRGDDVGHTYVNTCFFRKVPHLYWSGGDVIHNNGFGCYVQRGRNTPLGAENYHYPHSMPGLVSMRMTCDGEMCGIFSITFKPLPQFDLKNVVFGRVVRPSSTYEVISSFGSAFSTHPVVYIESAQYLGRPPVTISEEAAFQELEQSLPTYS